MSFTINAVAYLEPIELRGPDDVLIIDKVTGDWTKTLYLDGAKVTSPPTITVEEVTGDSGTYAASFQPDTVGQYALKLSVAQAGKTYRFSQSFEVETAAQADPVAALAGVAVSVVSPVAATGDITVYQGDDYKAIESRSLAFAFATLPSLVGASGVTFHAVAGSTHLFSASCVVSGAGTSAQAGVVDLTAAQTALLPTTAGTYRVRAVLASGDVATLASGWITAAAAIPLS